MDDNKLSLFKKVKLLAVLDRMHPGDYDKELYSLLCEIVPPRPDQFGDRKRRAIVLFVNAYWENLQGILQSEGMDNDTIARAGLHIMLTLGYELGRKLRRPLTRK